MDAHEPAGMEPRGEVASDGAWPIDESRHARSAECARSSQHHPQPRDLPSVDRLLRYPAIQRMLDEYPREMVLCGVRRLLDLHRKELRAGRRSDFDPPALALALREQLHERSRSRMRRVVNATGIVLHTGLGRAPLADEAVQAVADVAGAYCNLELDLEEGRRGDRHAHVQELLCELTGAEAGMAVNNNAAATLLALRSLAAGREVIVSRGQLVEIGGSFRMPDIMAAAGCRMVEVGTTNRTRISDFERAITPETAALLRVHTSNYRIVGFTETPALEELIELGRRSGLPVLDDLGSGLLDRAILEKATATGSPGFQQWDEPAARDSVAAGADVVLFSGDKLLGGPQAGVVVGRSAAIARMRNDPLARAVRPDKLAIAALEATLRLYREPATLAQRLPTLRMLTADVEALRARAERLAAQIRATLPQDQAGRSAHPEAAAVPTSQEPLRAGVGRSGVKVNCEISQSAAGGGALPALEFPTWVVRVTAAGASTAALAAQLRRRDVPVICRIQDEALLFDMRTIATAEEEEAAAAICELFEG